MSWTNSMTRPRIDDVWPLDYFRSVRRIEFFEGLGLKYIEVNMCLRGRGRTWQVTRFSHHRVHMRCIPVTRLREGGMEFNFSYEEVREAFHDVTGMTLDEAEKFDKKRSQLHP